jgi:monoamine oxidase
MISRRALVHAVGRAGGVAAAYRTMTAMGLLAVPEAYAGPPDLTPGNGAKVLILGAGIAGMVAALELGRAGYDCTILEARTRAGGRNWSLRAGDTVEETDSTQRVDWDAEPHLYFNPGPARLPWHHAGILGYCRELGVPLEVMSNENRGAWMQDDAAFDGRPQRNRAVVNDLRGHIAELAAKALDKAALDAPADAHDLERLRAMVRAFGALDRDLVYRGSQRAGWDVAPAAGDVAGRHASPLDLRALLQSDFWQFKAWFGESATQSATMLQPVGGMGRIGEAFARRVGERIVFGAEVREIRRAGAKARIVWGDRRIGAVQAIEADHVICTIPFPVLRGIDNDFAPATRQAMAALEYIPAGKVAFEAQERFWEREGIYGGISWTTRDATQIWYPTAGVHARKGVLVGAYIWSDDVGARFAAKTPAQRIADTLADGARIHPGYADHLAKGVTVAWPKIPYSGAGWAEWDDRTRAEAYPVLLQGDGPVLFAGEHMSFITGWQEGAVRSAHYAIGQIAARAANGAKK